MILSQKIVIILLEILGLIMVIRLWFKGGKLSLFRKIFWSVFLMVPLLGPVMYIFTSLDPSDHGEDVGDHSSGGGTGDTGHM